MYIIKNKVLPPKGYQCITFGPFVFTRSDKPLKPHVINHETIHWVQYKETLIIGFLIWYVIEFLIRYIISGFQWHVSYRNISLEREAYANEYDADYIKGRKHFAWLRYINDLRNKNF